MGNLDKDIVKRAVWDFESRVKTVLEKEGRLNENEAKHIVYL